MVLSKKRAESNAKSKQVRLNRREMIDILRDPQHLALDCDVHTYVMDRTCTNYEGLVDHERDLHTVKVNKTLGVGLFVLIAMIFAGIISLLVR